MTQPTGPTPAASVAVNDPQGAVWRRWEPHIHTPGTSMSDEFGATSLDTYLTHVESADPKIEALGITDYYLTRRYEEVLAARATGRIPQVKLLFCNIEMRLGIETKAGKGVNLHLLVSPDDLEHVEQIKRFLSRMTFHFAKDNYACTDDDLRRLGKAHDPSIVDDELALRTGVNQFKVDFQQLRQLYDETEWVRANTLVAVAGSSNDGTAGLQDETAGFAASRKEIEAFAHVIFTATPKNISFWRGEGVLDVEQLEAKYGGPKPCLHGSDAHTLNKVAKPDEDRYCWIKGDATFDALQQACFEPRLRAWIGPAPPMTDTTFSINTVATPSLPWLLPQPLPINPGMVAIIGARGSGKTALADLIAHAGNSALPLAGSQSFLTRAKAFLGAKQVTANWSGAPASVSQLDKLPEGLPEVHYLTQQFVDRLCSSVAHSDELLDEIKRVVFLAHEPATRLGADDFNGLARLKSSETQLAVEALNQRLDRLSSDVLIERRWYLRQSSLQRDLTKLDDELGKTDAARKALIQPGGKERADYYGRLGAAISSREQELQRLARQLQAFKQLDAEVTRYVEEIFPQLLNDLKQTYGIAGLSVDEWIALSPVFKGDPLTMLAERIAAQKQLGIKTRDAAGTEPSAKASTAELASCSLPLLKVEYKAVSEQIGADQKNVQRLNQLNDLYTTQETRRRRLEEELQRAKQSPERLKAVLADRAALYQRFFQLIIEQCEILAELYEPLAAQLADTSSSAQKLSLMVVRDVDFEAWARAGEELLDLRKNGTFRGRGALAQAARAELMPAWRNGTASEVALAMESFRGTHNQTFLDQSAIEHDAPEYQQWVVDLGRWLYSTDHIEVQYSIEYEGVPITQLSPGTRGIVLLLLYLALDLEDSRPLIIDQPEENLDPKSVFTELVELFRQARLRRQVIVVTHNANLVVNTDVDQVIVASCVKAGSGSPPQFHYQSGGLEDPDIRGQVCDILEGGETAFKQRARRLRVRFPPNP